MLHTIQLYYNKKGFSEATTLYTRRGDTGELLSATFKDEIDELLVLPEGTTTFDVSKVYFEAEGNGVFVRREVPAKYLDLTTPKKPRIKNFPMPAEMFAKGPNVVDNCYFRFELKTGAPTLDTDSPVTVSSSSFNTIVLGSPIPGIRSYYLDEIDYLIKEFEKAIAGYTPADIEAFYAELKAEIKLAKEQAKQDIEDLNALFVQSEADLRAKIVREIADMNKLIQNMQTSLDAQLLELQKQIDATKAQITTLDNKLVQVETDITNAKKEINQVKIDTTAEINQVKEDTTAQITKVKNDASTEINKIKNESISAVAAEKEAVIKMINDLKAEIAAMDLEQMVLDLFAQGKVKDVMVAEIQKEVTKQLTDKGAASQTWVEENFISSNSKKNNIKTSNLFSYQDIVPSGQVSVIKENSALFSGWSNVFVYNAKLPLYLTEGKEYTISYKYIPRKMTQNTVPDSQNTTHGCLALHSQIAGKPFIPLYDSAEVKVQKLELDKPLYRTWDFVCPKLDPAEGYNLIAYATRQMTPDGKTFVVIDPGEFVDVMITEKGVQGEWSIPERDLTSNTAGYRWYDSSSKLISGRTTYNLLVKESTDWKYVVTPSNLPGGVTGACYHRSVFVSETHGFVEIVLRAESVSYVNNMAGGAWQGWKKTTMDGQAQKITSDNGRRLFYFEDVTKTFHEMVIDKIKTTGYFKVQTFSTKGQPEQYINGMINVQLVNDNPLYYSYYFTGVAVGSGKMYSYSFHSQKDIGWSNVNGQVAKLTSDDGGSYITLSDKSKTTQELLDRVDKGYKFITFGEASDLPSSWIYGFISTNGNGGFKSFLGTSVDGNVYNYNTITKVWKRLDNESTTPEYPKEIPTASIGRYPTDKNTYQRDYIKAQLISETLLKVVGIITIYQDATLPNSVTVASISKSAQLGGKKLPTLMSQRKIASVRNTSGSNYESELNVSLADTGSSINVDINIFAFKGTLGASPNKIYIDVDIPLE